MTVQPAEAERLDVWAWRDLLTDALAIAQVTLSLSRSLAHAEHSTPSTCSLRFRDAAGEAQTRSVSQVWEQGVLSAEERASTGGARTSECASEEGGRREGV
eukprot:914413-Rhodomonas_salina.1